MRADIAVNTDANRAGISNGDYVRSQNEYQAIDEFLLLNSFGSLTSARRNATTRSSTFDDRDNNNNESTRRFVIVILSLIDFNYDIIQGVLEITCFEG